MPEVWNVEEQKNIAVINGSSVEYDGTANGLQAKVREAGITRFTVTDANGGEVDKDNLPSKVVVTAYNECK